MPVAAVADADKVSALVVEVEVGLKFAVTPLGRPVADKATLPVNPLRGDTEMVLPLAVPWVMVTVVGEAERLKSGLGFTVSVTEVVCVKLPEVPVIVTVTVPMAAVADALSVRVLVVVAGLILNPAVIPLGKPEVDRVTLPPKPLEGETVMVLPLAVP